MRSAIEIALCLFLVVLLTLGCLPLSTQANAVTMDLESTPQSQVSGQSIWDKGTELELIGTSHLAYRCAGSAGANESAEWIRSELEDMGLECSFEEFQFYGWDLRSPAKMEITFINSSGTYSRILGSFQAEHFSFPTQDNGSLGEVVLLPIPSANTMQSFATISFDPAYWEDLDLQDKVVLVGREVRWNSAWESELASKLEEGPKALIFYYSLNWTKTWEVMYMASSGGRPLSALGSYVYANEVPAGHLDSEDSEWLLARMAEGNISANVTIDASSGIWTHRNVVAKLPGAVSPEEQVILMAHYDSVMDPGFCDNAASIGALLEIASVISQLNGQTNYRPNYTILFVAVTGEEMGLIGSLNYVAQHQGEMDKVRALMNLDCLGAQHLLYTSTTGTEEFNLSYEFRRAALDLGVSATLQEVGSDQQSFIWPRQIADLSQSRWGMSPYISPNIGSVPNAIGIASGPFSPLDIETYGVAGWIHTSRDASEYRPISGWINASNFEEQTTVVLKVGLDIAGTYEAPSPAANILFALLICGSVGAALVVVVIWYTRKRSH